MNGNRESTGNHSNGLVVITGCDSGIGRSLVGILLEQGYTIVQSYLEQDRFENEPKVYSKKMDLRIPDEVEDFCQYVLGLCEKGERLEALIVNAGVALGGPVENLPMALYRECFEINYFGAVRIVQACIPELIRNKGKIIVNGSMAGKIAMPFLSPYVSSKFALEGFCDSLRREMKPFGVKTVLLEPAAVATPIWDKAKKQDVSFIEEKYLKCVTFFMDKFVEGGNRGLDVDIAASTIAGIVSSEKPKARYMIAKNTLVYKLLLLVPSSLLDSLIVKLYRIDYGTS